MCDVGTVSVMSHVAVIQSPKSISNRFLHIDVSNKQSAEGSETFSDAEIKKYLNANMP